jgi:hypothetical protein
MTTTHATALFLTIQQREDLFFEIASLVDYQRCEMLSFVPRAPYINDKKIDINEFQIWFLVQLDLQVAGCRDRNAQKRLVRVFAAD